MLALADVLRRHDKQVRMTVASTLPPRYAFLDPEQSIRRFEPRIVNLKVALVDSTDKVSGTLRLRIDALLHAEPAPEPIAFDTVVDLLSKNVTVVEQEA